MQLKKDIHKKTKHYFHKKLQNLMSFLFRRYQKLPKSPANNSFKDKSNPRRKQHNDLYRDLSEQWESDDDDDDDDDATVVKKSTNTIKSSAASESFTFYATQSVAKRNLKGSMMGESNKGNYYEQEKGDMSRRGLAQKMKELEMMMNVNDIDHLMDIEEALYLYSRLTCPVYLELLDKFFMDMYSEFFLPKPSLSVNNSMRRLGPVRL